MKLHSDNTFAQSAMEIIFSLNSKVLYTHIHRSEAAAKVLTCALKQCRPDTAN